MNARLAPAVIALAAGAGVVAHAGILPEFLLQLRDPNVLGGALYAELLRTFGYAFVLSLCGVLTAGTILLAAWRTRLRGASDWHGVLAALLVLLCMTGRAGISLDPIGWACCAAFCMLLDRDDEASPVNALAVLALWAVVQGGATLGALLALISLANGATRKRLLFAGSALVLGALQLHAAPWQAYGAHLLYLDALLHGSERDLLWGNGITTGALGFAAILIVAAWYGVRRRARPADAITFFVMFALTLVDARNLPYFGIVAAPIVADALASFYVGARAVPAGSVRQNLVTFLACAVAFTAMVTATEPKVVIWPQAPGQPALLMKILARDERAHRVLCTRPRWCDGAHAVFARITPLVDDRGALATPVARRAQIDASNATGNWRNELRRAGVDAVIAQHDDSIVALLTSTGWRESASDGSRVLLQAGAMP